MSHCRPGLVTTFTVCARSFGCKALGPHGFLPPITYTRAQNLTCLPSSGSAPHRAGGADSRPW